jgi:hypothetical protein
MLDTLWRWGRLLAVAAVLVSAGVFLEDRLGSDADKPAPPPRERPHYFGAATPCPGRTHAYYGVQC